LSHNLPIHVQPELIESIETMESEIDIESEIDMESDPDSESEIDMEDELLGSTLFDPILHYHAKIILQKAAKLLKNNTVNALVLMGVSGCGKTRSIYEVLCCKMGFYFTAAKNGNCGSTDMEIMCQELEMKLRKAKVI
jgi:hypothetical protein